MRFFRIIFTVLVVLMVTSTNQNIFSSQSDKFYQGLNSGNSFSTTQDFSGLSNEMELVQVIGEKMNVEQCLQHNNNVIIRYSFRSQLNSITEYGVLITDGNRKNIIPVNGRMDFFNGIAIDETNLYITHSNGITVFNLYAMRVAEEIVFPDVRSHPVVVGNFLYFHNNKTLVSYDLDRYEISRQLSIEPFASLPQNDTSPYPPPSINSRMSHVGNKLVLSGDYYNKSGRSIIACIDLNSLSLIWQKEYDLLLWHQYLKIVGTKLYFYGQSPINNYSKNGFYCLDMDNGNQIWMQNRCGTSGNGDAGCSKDDDGFLQFAVNEKYLVFQYRGLGIISTNDGSLLEHKSTLIIGADDNEIYLTNTNVWYASIEENEAHNKFIACYDIENKQYIKKIDITSILKAKNYKLDEDLLFYYLPYGLLVENHYLGDPTPSGTQALSNVLLFKNTQNSNPPLPPPIVGIDHMELKPDQASIEVSKSIQFTIHVNWGSTPLSQEYVRAWVKWSVEPQELGYIDKNGLFTAYSTGEGEIIAIHVFDRKAYAKIIVSNSGNTNPPPTEKSPAPTDLSLVYDKSSKAVNLSWNMPANSDISNITKYNIYKSTMNGSFTLAASIGSKGNMFYTDNDISNGKAYSYFIKAENAMGESMPSIICTITVPDSNEQPITLKKPNFFYASFDPINKTVSMSWQKPDDSEKYISYRVLKYKLSDKGYDEIHSFKSSLQQVSWTHVSPSSGSWYYCVQAYNEQGESPPSDPMKVDIP